MLYPNVFIVEGLRVTCTCHIVFWIQIGLSSHLGEGGGGGYSTRFCMEMLCPKSKPLPFCIPVPFSTEKVTLSYILYRKWYPFSYTYRRNIAFIYLQPQKGTPFGQSLPIMCSMPPLMIIIIIMCSMPPLSDALITYRNRKFLLMRWLTANAAIILACIKW